MDGSEPPWRCPIRPSVPPKRLQGRHSHPRRSYVCVLHSGHLIFLRPCHAAQGACLGSMASIQSPSFFFLFCLCSPPSEQLTNSTRTDDITPRDPRAQSCSARWLNWMLIDRRRLFFTFDSLLRRCFCFASRFRDLRFGSRASGRVSIQPPVRHRGPRAIAARLGLYSFSLAHLAVVDT